MEGGWGNLNFFSSSGPRNTEPEVKDIEDNGAPQRSYKSAKDYIPSKFATDRCFRLSVILGSIAIFTIIVVITTTVLHLKSIAAVNEYDESSDNSIRLVLSGSKGLLFYNMSDGSINDHLLGESSIGVYEVYGAADFFWNDFNTSTIHHNQISKKHPNSEDSYAELFKELRVKPQDMAYDNIGDNLYVIDRFSGSLIVINVPTKFYDILLTDLIRPHHIQVDPERGLMFILQQSDSILRGSMDGTSMMKIVKSEYLTALTIDAKHKRIYWANHDQGIESSDYEGEHLESFSIDTSNILDLAVANNKLFWLWEQYSEDEPTHHLISCKLRNGICDDHTVDDLDHLGEFGSIKAVHMDVKRDPSAKTACSDSGCQHFCLLSHDKAPKCACKLGWQLDLDKKSCKETKEFLIYTLGNYFRGRILDSARNYSIDTILPTPYEIKAGQEISFDYDMTNDNLFFSDNKNIHTMKLKSNWTGQSMILQGEENDTNIKDIAYDWITGNLYYIQSKLRDGYKIQVINVKLGSQYNKTVIDSNPESGLMPDGFRAAYFRPAFIPDFQERTEANSISVHPNLGYLTYFVVKGFRERKGFVHITSTNGTEITQISDTAYPVPGLKSVAIDFSDKRVYWINEEYMGKIKSASFHGQDIRDITLQDLRPLRAISVHKKWIYINTYHNIYRVDKATGGNKVRMAPILGDNFERQIGGVKIFSESIMKSADNLKHPCNNQHNGGCDQFCFSSIEIENSNAVCACRDGENFGPQGHCIIS